MTSLELASKLYRVPLVDYERSSTGVLVGSGCGLMLSVMDSVQAFRWCVDVDHLRDPDVASFLEAASFVVPFIGIVGWFTITRPETILRGIAAMKSPPLCYLANVPDLNLPRLAHSLDEFVSIANRDAKRLIAA